MNPDLSWPDEILRKALGFTKPEWRSLKTAAADASMELRQYMHLMLLSAVARARRSRVEVGK